jgi:hypothetical protein
VSTLRVDNFGPSAGGTTYSARGIAKAWVNFNGTGTIAVRNSENVTSLTDNGIGEYFVNLTSSMGNADYSISGMAQDPSSSGGSRPRTGLTEWSDIPSTTTAIKVVSYASNTAEELDSGKVLVKAHGDLA